MHRHRRSTAIVTGARRGALGERARREGFSLVEVMIALALIGIIASMAIPHVDTDRYAAEGAVRVVRATLQGAQRGAILRQTDVLVAFDSAAGQLLVIEDANNNGQADAGERVTARGLGAGARFVAPTATLSGCASNAIGGSGLLQAGGRPTIAFMRDGAANSDLCVFITAGHDRSGTIRAVRVSQATGGTELWHYTGSRWTRSDA